MGIERVALIFDDKARPETTGIYCKRALAHQCHVHHYRPSEINSIPEAFDLYLNIDDGLHYSIPTGLHPSAWWAIDTHLDFEWCASKSRDFDYVFCAQRDGATKLRERGIERATWLPLACDPEIHVKVRTPKKYDVCFVGNLFPGLRSELVGLIQKHFDRVFVGQLYFEQMAQMYSASRIVFNQSITNDINMRVFEAIASGSLLLTNELDENGQDELLRDGVHLATYHSAEDMLEKIRYFLKHPRIRERIARVGSEEVLKKHTYGHRMQQVLEIVQASSSHDRKSNSRPPKAVEKDISYFDFARPEVLELIPKTAKRLLEIGCGAGRLAEAVKQCQSVDYIGVEVDSRAAAQARQRMDRVIEGDIETKIGELTSEEFDCIVCADVLEHLLRPGELLQSLRGMLSPNGIIVASIPNVRHHTVVRSLLEGNWTYEAAGLLDRTHLHFFTRRTIIELFEFAGLRIRSIQAVPGPNYAEWQATGRPDEVHVGRLHISSLPPNEAEEFYIYQYLVTAESAEQINKSRDRLRQKPHARRVTPPSKPSFSQDFIADFEQFKLDSEPFAFVRFGDGERAIATGKPVSVAPDGWSYDGHVTSFANDLNAALQYTAPDYYIGISDSCCDRQSHEWYLEQLKVPLEQVTFANIFVNWNYRRFLQLDLDNAAIVASVDCDFRIPEDIIASNFDLDHLVTELLPVDRPIIVAAGPASAIIIHKYWQRAINKQTILDVGSAIDERTKGRKTRTYHHPGSRTSELVCFW